MSSRWDSVTTLLGHRKAALQTLLQEWQDFSCRKEGWNERVQLVVGRLAAQVWDVTVQPVPAVKKQRQVVEVGLSDVCPVVTVASLSALSPRHVVCPSVCYSVFL